MATTYKLNNDERATLGCGYTHVSKVSYTEFATDGQVTLYTLQSGDVVHPVASVYVKTALSGGSLAELTIGTSVSGTQTVNIFALKDLHGAAAGATFASLGPTSTTEAGKSYAASTTITAAFNVTGTYTVGEIYIFFTVGQLGTLAGSLQL